MGVPVRGMIVWLIPHHLCLGKWKNPPNLLKIGARVEKGSVGKRGLEELKMGEGTMLANGRALLGNEKDGWEVATDMVRVGNLWTNGKVALRCGKKGLDESEWKVWEDEEMKDTFEGRGEAGEGDVEMEGGVEVKVEKEEKWVRRDVDEVLEESLRGVKGEKWAKEEEKKREIKRGKEVIEVIDLCGSSEEESGVGLIEEWKEKKVGKEKRERNERRKREVEGMVNRGEDRGMRRKDIMEMKQAFEDYEEVVGDVGYVLGIEVGLARCFVMDREIRKAMDMMMDMGLGKKRSGRRMSEEMEEERREVRSEVVVEEGLREKEELVRAEGVKGGRTYGEVLKGVGNRVENEEVVERMERERMALVERGIEREERSGKVVEIVMDSQKEMSGEQWKEEEVVKELEVAKGSVEKVKVNGNRIKVVFKDNVVAEGVEKRIKEDKEKVLGGGVVEVKRNENWVGLVVPGVNVDMWEGNMGLLKKYIEEENGISLMRVPRWLVNEDRRKSMGLKSVGVVVHVARESVRVKLVEEGLKWDERVVQVKRYVEEKQLVFCTKCAMVGHNWWQCERRVLRCSVCAVDGHAGWMHRCGRCNVHRKGCEHYRKCAMCGKAHTVGEAREGNCLGVRAEMMRLRSLNY